MQKYIGSSQQQEVKFCYNAFIGPQPLKKTDLVLKILLKLASFMETRNRSRNSLSWQLRDFSLYINLTIKKTTTTSCFLIIIFSVLCFKDWCPEIPLWKKIAYYSHLAIISRGLNNRILISIQVFCISEYIQMSLFVIIVLWSKSRKYIGWCT